MCPRALPHRGTMPPARRTAPATPPPQATAMSPTDPRTDRRPAARNLCRTPGLGDTGAMWIGWIEFDILLGDVHSRKAKRSAVRPIIAEVRKQFQISVAEVGHLDLYR